MCRPPRGRSERSFRFFPKEGEEEKEEKKKKKKKRRRRRRMPVEIMLWKYSGGGCSLYVPLLLEDGG